MESPKCAVCDVNMDREKAFSRFNTCYCSMKCLDSDRDRIKKVYKDLLKDEKNTDYRPPDYGGAACY